MKPVSTDSQSDQKPEKSLDAAAEATITARIELENKHKGGAGWFFWIAALSVINSAIVLAQGEWSFAVGLGFTQIIDAIAVTIAEDAAGPTTIMVAAFVMNLVIASVFVMMGYFARKGAQWAFVTGMIFYALDGLIFLAVFDILSFGFHLFALWGIFAGLRACRSLKSLPHQVKTSSNPEPDPVSISISETVDRKFVETL